MDRVYYLYDLQQEAQDILGMTDSEIGAYTKIKHMQFRLGSFTEKEARKTIGKRFDRVWPALKMCMAKDGAVYYIPWIEWARKKRDKYIDSRKENGSKNTGKK